MGDKISKKFRPLEKVLDKMYKECMNMDEEMFFLCHLILLDDESNAVDDVIRAWGTKEAIQIMLDVLKRQIGNPENYIDKNDPIPTVRVYDSRDKYDAIGNTLANLKTQYPGISGYCILTIGTKGAKKELDSSLFIIGEKNILDTLPPFIEQLLAMPECIQDGRIIRWQMTSFS